VAPLLRDSPTLEALQTGQSLDRIKQGWAAELERFKERRERHLLYR